MVQDLGVQPRGSENLSIICVELQHLDPLASCVLVAQRNQCFRGKGLNLQQPPRDCERDCGEPFSATGLGDLNALAAPQGFDYHSHVLACRGLGRAFIFLYLSNLRGRCSSW